ELRSQLHVRAFDVEPAGRLHAGGSFPLVLAQPAAVEEHPLSTWNRFSAQVFAPAQCDRIGFDRAVGSLVRLEQDREAHNAPVSVADDAETLWRLLPPRDQLCGGRIRFVSTCDRGDRRTVCGSRRLDREDMLGCWE